MLDLEQMTKRNLGCQAGIAIPGAPSSGRAGMGRGPNGASRRRGAVLSITTSRRPPASASIVSSTRSLFRNLFRKEHVERALEDELNAHVQTSLTSISFESCPAYPTATVLVPVPSSWGNLAFT